MLTEILCLDQHWTILMSKTPHNERFLPVALPLPLGAWGTAEDGAQAAPPTMRECSRRQQVAALFPAPSVFHSRPMQRT